MDTRQMGRSSTRNRPPPSPQRLTREETPNSFGQNQVKVKIKSKQDESQERVANPFELLPLIPGDDQPAPKMPRQADKKIKGKQEFKSAAEMKKRAKEVAAEVEAEQNESSENVDDEELKNDDPAQNLLSKLRTLLSIYSTRRDDVIEAEALARDVLAGRARTTTTAEVWGVVDLGG
ncbi:hypothetical protein FRC09_003520 [Ceratobasidium sp. 395]|nr:hypothetical protein FRC09_003520 [Ceratobasidium sp. 395]